MKATAFSSQSVTTFADAVLIGVKRHAASNNHALLRVMAVLRDVHMCGRAARASANSCKAPADDEVAPAHAEPGVFSPVTPLGLPHAQPAARQPASPWARPESF